MARTTVASLQAEIAELKALLVAQMPADTAPAKASREVSPAAAHCRDARLARRAANPTTAHGLTKAEKSYLYHTFADYSVAVAAYKALSAEDQAAVLAGGDLAL